MEESKTLETQGKSQWGSGIAVGILVGVALFVLTYALLIMAK
jgi:hypothetical protein